MLTNKPNTATDVLKRYIYTSSAFSVHMYTTVHTGIARTLICGACERVLVLHRYNNASTIFDRVAYGRVTTRHSYMILTPVQLQCYSHTWSGACGRLTIVHPIMILAPVEESQWYTHTWSGACGRVTMVHPYMILAPVEEPWWWTHTGSWRLWKSHDGTPIHDL